MTRELELAEFCARLADLPPGAEPCSECREIWPSDDMVDCADLAPFAGACCPRCERALLSDLRDEGPSDGELRRREAALRVGGGGWLEDER